MNHDDEQIEWMNLASSIPDTERELQKSVEAQSFVIVNLQESLAKTEQTVEIMTYSKLIYKI